MATKRKSTKPPARTSPAPAHRPALPEADKRSAKLMVKLKPAEKAQLQTEADNAGLPLALYARLVLTKRSIPDAK